MAVSDPDLKDIEVRANEVTEEVRARILGLNDAQQCWRTEPGRWSLREIFDHLFVTGTIYYPRIRGAIERTRLDHLEPTRRHKPTLLGGFLLKALRPEARPVPAPKAFRPAADPAACHAIADFLTQQQDFLELIRDADGYDLNRIRFRNPVLGLLKNNIGDGLAMTAAHQYRHLLQARKVLENPQFPG